MICTKTHITVDYPIYKDLKTFDISDANVDSSVLNLDVDAKDICQHNVGSEPVKVFATLEEFLLNISCSARLVPVTVIGGEVVRVSYLWLHKLKFNVLRISGCCLNSKLLPLVKIGCSIVCSIPESAVIAEVIGTSLVFYKAALAVVDGTILTVSSSLVKVIDGVLYINSNIFNTMGDRISSVIVEGVKYSIGGEVSSSYGTSSEIGISQTFFTEKVQKMEAALFPFSITSFTGGGVYEIGSSQNINLSWSFDREITYQDINGDILDNSIRNKVFPAVTGNMNFTLSAKAGDLSAAKTVSVQFKLKKYYGVSSKESLDNSDILALSNTWAQRQQSNTVFDCTGGKYPFYIIPSNMTSGIQFWIGGLRNTDWNEEEILVTNQFGHSESYTVFRMNILQTGILNIEVK